MSGHQELVSLVSPAATKFFPTTRLIIFPALDPDFYESEMTDGRVSKQYISNLITQINKLKGSNFNRRVIGWLLILTFTFMSLSFLGIDAAWTFTGIEIAVGIFLTGFLCYVISIFKVSIDADEKIAELLQQANRELAEKNILIKRDQRGFQMVLDYVKDEEFDQDTVILFKYNKEQQQFNVGAYSADQTEGQLPESEIQRFFEKIKDIVEEKKKKNSQTSLILILCTIIFFILRFFTNKTIHTQRHGDDIFGNQDPEIKLLSQRSEGNPIAWHTIFASLFFLPSFVGLVLYTFGHFDVYSTVNRFIKEQNKYLMNQYDLKWFLQKNYKAGGGLPFSGIIQLWLVFKYLKKSRLDEILVPQKEDEI